jgi:hypothetical protein
VQTLAGSLQPLPRNIDVRELIKFDKQTVEADYAFFVAKSKFTSSANESELKEANQMDYGSRTIQISGIVDWSVNPHSAYYKVMLREVK